MENRVPRTWREQFEASLERMTASEGPSLLAEPSVDAYLRAFPIDPDEQWGSEMDELHRAALRASVLRHVAFISDDLERAVAVCESPPERAMLYALAIVAWDWVDGVLVRLETGASGLMATHGTYIELEPQAQIATHRVDFLLTMRLRTGPEADRRARLVVECDGHDWHERTPEQARRDRARDRALQARDLAVYRYTGSDVWRDVFAAAQEAVTELARRFGD